MPCRPGLSRSNTPRFLLKFQALWHLVSHPLQYVRKQIKTYIVHRDVQKFPIGLVISLWTCLYIIIRYHTLSYVIKCCHIGETCRIRIFDFLLLIIYGRVVLRVSCIWCRILYSSTCNRVLRVTLQLYLFFLFLLYIMFYV